MKDVPLRSQMGDEVDVELIGDPLIGRCTKSIDWFGMFHWPIFSARRPVQTSIFDHLHPSDFRRTTTLLAAGRLAALNLQTLLASDASVVRSHPCIP
jgi:hypothetical protein